MRRIAVFAYGLIAYGLFFATFLYLIGFVGGFLVPKTINDGPATPFAAAVAVNVLLIALFGVQHSTMARLWFKRWWTRYVPKPIERSTFVLITSLILLLLFWQWRPVPGIVWQVDQPIAAGFLVGLYFVGWAMVLYSSFLIDHFDLFGLRQVFLYLRNRPYTFPNLIVRSLYRWVRHPLMLGFLIALWSAPTMTASRLLFSAGMTAYIFIGIKFEERDLAHHLGANYTAYRTQTPMLLPLPKWRERLWRRRA